MRGCPVLAASPRSLLMLGLNQNFDVSITNFMVGWPAPRGPARDGRQSWGHEDLHSRRCREGPSPGRGISPPSRPGLKRIFNPFGQSFLPTPRNDSFPCNYPWQAVVEHGEAVDDPPGHTRLPKSPLDHEDLHPRRI